MTASRERDRYSRKDWRERLGDAATAIRSHPKATILVAVFLGGWAILLLLRPTVVTLDDVAAGDCLYVRAGGGPAEFAERAGCEASHSHEVLWVEDLGDAGTPFPSDPATLADEQVRCDEALADLGGEGSGTEPVLVATFLIPTHQAWDAGVRRGACLVMRLDGDFLQRPVTGG